MENKKLKVLTAAQFDFLASKEAAGYYDDRTREQMYSLIEKLEARRKYCSRDEIRLLKILENVEFGILLPANRKTTGNLKFKVSLCVNGDHEGDITTGGVLIINNQGSVRGNILAGEVICKGRINGDVRARQKLTLYSSGVLEGDLVAPAVQVAPGALFKGKCKLGSPQTPSPKKEGKTDQPKGLFRPLFKVK